jgi:hypothetical protein
VNKRRFGEVPCGAGWLGGHYAGVMSDDKPTYVSKGQEFARDMNYVPDRITKDARTPEPTGR